MQIKSIIDNGSELQKSICNYMETYSNLTRQTKKFQRAGDTIFSADCTQVFNVACKEVLFIAYCQGMNITENTQPTKISKDKNKKIWLERKFR